MARMAATLRKSTGRWVWSAWAGLCAALAPLQGAWAQAPDSTCTVHLQSADLVGPAADLARLIDLQDSVSRSSFLLRRAGEAYAVNACSAPVSLANLGQRLDTDGLSSGVRLLPAELLVVGNSAYPRDWNDGALWAGRGINAAMTGGAQIRWGAFSAAASPVIAWQPNAAFDTRLNIAGTSAYGHPWWGGRLDAPQRFGGESFAIIDPGQTYARVEFAGVAAGLSTENLTWGPARRNPLLLSGTAPGFAHGFLESARPLDVFIGDLEFQLLWGRLDESEYFDEDPDNDHRMLAGFVFALQPRILEGLAIGGGRMESFTWWPGLSLAEVMLRPYRGITENPADRALGDNQLITVFFRWSDAPHGMEVYGEWARDDHWGDLVQLLRNLDSSQAWTLGFQKLIRRDDNAVRIAAEITHLSDALPVLFAGRPGLIPFYSNTSVTQGHTHRGQMLGAPIGTGAESQWLGVDLFWRAGRTGVSVERARYEDDAYHALFAPRYGARARDVEVSVRAGHFAAFGAWSAHADLGWSRRYNRSFLGLDANTSGSTFRQDNNFSLRLGARWTPGQAGVR